MLYTSTFDAVTEDDGTFDTFLKGLSVTHDEGTPFGGATEYTWTGPAEELVALHARYVFVVGDKITNDAHADFEALNAAIRSV